MDGFLLAYDGFDPEAEGLREALTSTGNGYLCARGAAEWEDADGVHYPGTYVHGGYNRETTILGGLPARGSGSEIAASGARLSARCCIPRPGGLTRAARGRHRNQAGGLGKLAPPASLGKALN